MSGPFNTSPFLCGFNLMLYKLPVRTSPTNISFSYCFPNLDELRNVSAVGATGVSQENSGGLYFPFPPNSTRLLGCIGATGPGPDDSPPACHIPCTLVQPLLNPGSTKFISSPNAGPFSVSHNCLLIGSKPIPKPFRIP